MAMPAPSVRVTLIGPDARELRDDAGGRWKTVHPGETIAVIPELADRLLEQTDLWAAADGTPKPEPADAPADTVKEG
jgi:hypothetical protein